MKVIKPNSEDQLIEGISIFLAGSIEMGAAIDWQSNTEERLKFHENLTIFNPRREDWNSSWKQKQSNEQFNHQVNWELNHLDRADIIFMYLLPDTKSPISLLELGLHADDGNMIVCCPKEFWREGNVEIVCTRYRIPLFDNYEDAFGAVRTILNSFIQ